MMSNFIQILFIMSIKTSILILLILTVKYLFNRFFTAKTHYGIWFLLFISLTIPYTPQSDLSIYNILKYFDQNTFITNMQPGQNVFLNGTYTKNINKEKLLPKNNEYTLEEEKKDPDITTNVNNNTLDTKSKVLKIVHTLYTSKNLINIFTYIWLSGVFLLGCIIILKTIQTHKLICKEKEILDTKILCLLHKCKSRLGIEKNIKLVETKSFSTPSLIGVVYPKILLPEQILANFDNEKLELILLHELAHLKRKDILINWLIIIYQILYWFNPMVWIGFYKMKSDMELACDSSVLKHLEKEKHITYGKVIIDLLEYFSNKDFVPVTTNILKNKYEVKRRIIMIKKFNKTSYKFTFISFLLIALVGYSSISTAKTNTDHNPTGISEKVTKEIPVKNNKYFISLSDAQKIFKDKNNIIGKDYEYIWNIIDSPNIATYYVNTKSLTPDEVLKKLSSEAIYPIKSEEESSALYVFMENNKIVDIKIDEFSGLLSNTWKNSDYKVNFYAYPLGSDIDDKDLPHLKKDDPDLAKLKKEFLGKSLSYLNNKFNLTHGGYEAFNKEGNLQLSVYSIVSKEYASGLGALYVLSENNIIKDIDINKQDLQFERLDEHFSLTNKNN